MPSVCAAKSWTHGGHLLSVEQTVSRTNLSICVWLLHLVVATEVPSGTLGELRPHLKRRKTWLRVPGTSRTEKDFSVPPMESPFSHCFSLLVGYCSVFQNLMCILKTSVPFSVCVFLAPGLLLLPPTHLCSTEAFGFFLWVWWVMQGWVPCGGPVAAQKMTVANSNINYEMLFSLQSTIT